LILNNSNFGVSISKSEILDIFCLFKKSAFSEKVILYFAQIGKPSVGLN